MLRTDNDIQEDLVAELKWEQGTHDEDIAVSVRDGVVTLAGTVDSYADKWKAERVATRIEGVKAIANNIEVRLPSSSERSDSDIAHAAAEALKWNIWVPEDRVKVKVSNGWLTLEGEVDWYYQKEEADRALRKRVGIKGISNLIAVKKRPLPHDVKEQIKRALARSAEFDADRISVEVSGDKVILSGTVRSYVEKRDAERAARNAPGVTQVENRITVDPSIPAPV